MNEPRSLFNRLSKLFKSGPVVKRKIRNADTTIAVADKTKSSGALLFQKSMSPTYATITSQAYNLSERMMRYQDYTEMQYCLSGDTKIAIPYGFKTIEELAKECSLNPDMQFIVYAYDHEKKQIVPAYAKQARQTKTCEAYKVTFDNGKQIIGSSNHRLMLRDGTFCRIDELKVGDAMMPFYRKEQKVYIIDKNKTWVDESDLIKDIKIYIKDDNSIRKDVTFGRILSICERIGFDNVTLKKLELALDVSQKEILNLLLLYGFQKFETFVNAYHKAKFTKEIYENYCSVLSIESCGVMPLYDLTVDGYKNFATDSVISHNTPEIASTLDIFSDEITASDEKGQILHIYSENEKIKEILEDLFYNVLNVNFNLRAWTRSLCQHGDLFLFNDVHPNYGIVNAFPIPVNEIEREENYDREDPFSVRFRWVTLGNRTLENWEVSHFRLLGNDMFLPYGTSVIEPARRIWRQLILIEDAMLVYRVVRAPERRVFYVDVANIPPDDVEQYIEKQKKAIRTNQVVDNTSGKVDLRYNPMSIDEDYWLPVRGSDTGTRIDTLAGGQNTAAVEDVAYIQKKLFAALKIPKAYIGYDEALSSKAGLAQLDIRFSRTINSIQKTIISELNKMAIIHLYAHGYDGDDLQNFSLQMSNPSTIAQQQKLELWRSKFEIGGSLPENMGSTEFVQREIWGLSTDEIQQINKQRIKEKLFAQKLETIGTEQEGEESSSGDESAEDLFGSFGDEEKSSSESKPEKSGEELETAAEDPEKIEPELSLLTSSEDHVEDESFPLKLSIKEDDKPIKPSQLKHSLYNHSRKRTHGASKTFMPDLNKMTKIDDDVTDKNFTRDFVSNPFGESIVYKQPQTVRISRDIQSAINNMTKKLQLSNKSNSLLNEDVQSEIDVRTKNFEDFNLDFEVE